MALSKETMNMRPYDDLVINGSLESFTVKLRKLDSGEAKYLRGALLDLATDGAYVLHGGEATTASEEFNGDGATKEFTLTGTASGFPSALASVVVGDTDPEDWTYNASTGKVTFTTAPAAGTKNIVVTYATEALVADAVLAEDAELNDDDDIVVLAYRKGTFSQTVIEQRTAASNGDVAVTINAADEIALRSAGIYLVDSVEL